MTFTNPSNGPYQNAKGDLTVGTGAGLQPAILSVGSNTQVLTADSTQPTGMKWAATSGGSGGLVFIETKTASNSSALTFTTGLTYTNYYLLLTSVVPTVAASNLVLQVSTNGGSSYLGTGYAGGAANGTIGTGGAQTNGGAISYGAMLAYRVASSASGYSIGVSGNFTLNNSSAQNSTIVGQTTYYYDINGSSYNWHYSIGAGGAMPPSWNAFQILYDNSGLIASGTVSLYGFNQ